MDSGDGGVSEVEMITEAADVFGGGGGGGGGGLGSSAGNIKPDCSSNSK